eukprot:gb/GECG01016361.1/.p1 GENE.gb/GECG01016361.1/~~gb/GECG01016361.1/.p1  ORF type:complete len:183 (+),score=22.83 gb/GECG01016361.1/:1-549(+)
MSSAPENMKVLLVGPQKVGKSRVANYMADMNKSNLEEEDENSSEYMPTAGCRIVEVEREIQGLGTHTIELWDVSGDQSYETCWPAIQKDASGIILMYSPEKQQDREIELWYEWFVHNTRFDPKFAILMAYTRARSNKRIHPPKGVSHLRLYEANAEEPSSIKGCLDEIVTTILQSPAQSAKK